MTLPGKSREIDVPEEVPATTPETPSEPVPVPPPSQPVPEKEPAVPVP